VRILHPEPAPDAGPLVTLLARLRARVAERHRLAFQAAGADDVAVLAGPPDDTPFGDRLRERADEVSSRGAGLIVLGSGAIPLATARDVSGLVATAASGEPRALVNNRFSADVIAIGDARWLGRLPPLASDNALPRWLAAAGVTVEDRHAVSRLQPDLDSPLDALVVGGSIEAHAREAAAALGVDLKAVDTRLEGLRRVARDASAELLVAGRTSARTIRWLERHAACRVRALVEERGMRTAPAHQRQPASMLGMLLDRGGAASLGSLVARLADGALVDSRVLLAHRCGRDEGSWPDAEDRFASDLLLADLVRDPWLAALTRSARDAPIPILLGGHTLVGPGVPFALGGTRR